ncbi:hypothetical protein NHX12_024524 [Muraenolepis orangiensis]|uniref:G-protein coupled receptors family 1 profile domain-containing protein n=1 Tax=Muraenolepis orangiensis TaxID=630683 RepID=A0A9Q0EL77_9TELE|nr:hypothetical protein NHX12_024524 [Muraenolepis orangiensis]
MVPRHPFPTVDVPDHAHYTIGIVILVVGITGMLGNFLVIYVFCRSRSLRTPANMFIINLAVTDLLMCVTQTPIFFTTSMHKRWIFGEKGCELYAFCGALFGICSMITLMAIAVDRYVVITRPLASLGVMAVCKINGEGTRDSIKKMHKMKGEWKMAKIALIVILLYVVSWAPYSCVALTAFAGYADMLTPYMNSVPAVIAKASAIHNPIIYAITHPKYRAAISRYVPYLGALLCVPTRDRFTSSSFQSTRQSTLTSQSSEFSRAHKPRLSFQSDSESGGFSDMEADVSMQLPLSRQYSSDRQVRHTSQRSKVRGRDSGVFERAAVHTPTDPSICHLSLITTQADLKDISMSDFSLKSVKLPAAENYIKDDSETTSVVVVVTSKSSPPLSRQPPGFLSGPSHALKVLDAAIPVAVAVAPGQTARRDEALPCMAVPEPHQCV